MTTVAVQQTDKYIEMSCDSQVSKGRNKYTMNNKDKGHGKFSKIININEMLIGTAGLASEAMLIQLFAKNHRPKDTSQESVLEFLLEFRDWIAKRTGDESYALYNSYLLAYDKVVYDIDAEDYYVRAIDDFWAIGSGSFLAISALHLGNSTKKAIEIAVEYDLYSGGEIVTEKLSYDK